MQSSNELVPDMFKRRSVYSDWGLLGSKKRMIRKICTLLSGVTSFHEIDYSHCVFVSFFIGGV